MTIQRNRRGLSTRQAILDAARRLLEKEGFESLSVGAVARAAGVTRSSVYHQFRSRDGLFLHLIADSLRSLQQGRDVRRRFPSALDRFLDEAERGFRADPELVRMFYLLIFDRGWSRPEVRRLLREAYRFRTRRMAAGLAADMPRISARDRETLSIVLAAVFDGLYARSLIDLGPTRTKSALGLVGRMVRAVAE